MTLFFIRLFYRSDPEASSRERFPLNQSDLEQEFERHRQQAVERLREVRADYSLERRIFY
jgi:hypothetical protein